MRAVYQNAQKYVKEENDVYELNKFKSRITQELSKLENRSDLVSKTHSVTASIIQVQKEKCQKLLELLDQKINQVATRSLTATFHSPSSVTSPPYSCGRRDLIGLNKIGKKRKKSKNRSLGVSSILGSRLMIY